MTGSEHEWEWMTIQHLVISATKCKTSTLLFGDAPLLKKKLATEVFVSARIKLRNPRVGRGFIGLTHTGAWHFTQNQPASESSQTTDEMQHTPDNWLTCCTDKSWLVFCTEPLVPCSASALTLTRTWRRDLKIPYSRWPQDEVVLLTVSPPPHCF